MKIPAHTKIEEWQRLNAKTKASLQTLGILTLDDLLRHFPRRFEDRTTTPRFPSGPSEIAVAIEGIILSTRMRKFGGKRSLFEAIVAPAEESPLGLVLHMRWFNLPWMGKTMTAGQLIFAFGKIKEQKTSLVMDHPEIEVIDGDDEDPSGIHVGRVTPIYGLTAGLKQKTLRSLMYQALKDTDMSGILPEFPKTVKKLANELLGFEPHDEATLLANLHFPATLPQADTAIRHMALLDFLGLQLGVLARRQQVMALAVRPRCGKGVLLAALAKSLPYTMTEAQKRVVREIRADLKMARPMLRLLQGDVGSGKTAVAMAAAALAVESGCQVAVMAPTRILAEQQFQAFSQHFSPMGLTVILMTGSQKPGKKSIPEQRADIIVGTHALLFAAERNALEDLGLVVIDEQHKFGVSQRTRLADNVGKPHLLVMSATPIPRTLTMTLYGDLDVSIIDELPPGRAKTITRVRVAPKVNDVAAFVRSQLSEGRQAYIVYPLIEDSEKLDVQAANSGYEYWVKKLPDWRVGLLTSRTDAEEKESIMRDFRTGSLHVLVSTTVIEVGVDVPNASVMLVNDAGRFGLAQLHQIRGRVGRGIHTSYCVLLLQKKDKEVYHRLKILEETSDGFAIAEEDLRQRGPGDVLGTAQSGLPSMGCAALAHLADTTMLVGARKMAEVILKLDPNLQEVENAQWRKCLPRSDVASVIG